MIAFNCVFGVKTIGSKFVVNNLIYYGNNTNY